MTYVSTLSSSLALRRTVLQLQSAFAKAQTEVSTGKVADTGLALGYASGRTVSLAQEKTRLQAITDSNALVSSRLASTLAALTALGTSAQGVQASLISSAGDAGSAAAIAAQGKVGLQALTTALATTADGQYVFGGINSDIAPVTDYFASPPGSAKQAVDTAFYNTFGFSQTDPAAAGISATDMQDFLNIEFASLFQGPGWTSAWSQASDETQSGRIAPSQSAQTSVTANRSGFQQLAQAYTMLAEFAGGNLNKAASAVVRNTAQQLIGAASGDLTAARTGVGVTQTAIAQADTAMSTQMDTLTTSLGDLENVDPYEASTRVANLQTQLQASYQLTAQIQKMSLLDYLR